MTIQIAVRLPDDLVHQLDAVVATGGGPDTRTGAIRAAVELYVRSVQRRAVDDALRRGYAAEPPGNADEWGRLDEQSDAATSLALRELDQQDGGW
jgi:Arc/MetJ-type ribon-helix-helix transcriptional regulator